MLRLFFLGALPFLLLVLVVGAAVLWTRTKRPAALIQFIASSVVFVLVVLEQVAKYLDSIGKPALWQSIRDPQAESVAQILIIVSFVAFPAAYIWDAFRQKRI